MATALQYINDNWIRHLSNGGQWEGKRAQNSTIKVSHNYYTFESAHNGDYNGACIIVITDFFQKLNHFRS